MRQVLLIGMPFGLPLALYLFWFMRASRAATAAGQDAPKLGDVPWPWLVAIGVLLIFGALGAYLSVGGDDTPGGHYEPAKLIDGRVVPGHTTH